MCFGCILCSSAETHSELASYSKLRFVQLHGYARKHMSFTKALTKKEEEKGGGGGDRMNLIIG